MLTQASWFTHPLRVRYQETDQMGVVFHGNYVTWFEIGRTEWIRNAGYSYKEIEANGLLLPVVDLECRYILPARYDDMVIVCTRIGACTPVRVTFESQVRRVGKEEFEAGVFAGSDQLPGELLVEGGTKHVWVNASWQPARLNKVMPELFNLLLTK
ncbi:acyl-CoA thioester hydrolase [Paenibacillus endophyticus]|uniref:Acyl-CoA thioester hydrolase n=1 Tax=Paenibacillus endophyticus TaxID=1294268 RepID=A0A7W5C2X9_9BACL|nr:thioesterase family protein [Paenibacillus endophyticus]MBB3150111.1 acyl-CoA thioester hydrolase [Paenibacillus endophyticus]